MLVVAGMAVAGLALRGLEPKASQPPATCSSPAECRLRVADAAAGLNACLWSCSEEAQAHDRALRALHRVEERVRVRQHYQRRSELEREEERAGRLAREAERAKAAARAADAAEREQRHRLELARLRFEQQQRRRRADRQRLVSHFARLGRSARQARLEHCVLESASACDEVLSALLDASESAAESAELIRRFEVELRRQGAGKTQDSPSQSGPEPSQPRS